MRFKPTAIIDKYPPNEKPKLDLLENLFRDWHQHFKNNNDSSLKPHEQSADKMVFDGFYPHYFSQKKRILFIGWETLEMYEGNNYIEDLYDCYSRKKCVGDWSLDRYPIERRLLKIAYGILNGMPEWNKIDKAVKLSDTFGVPKGWSFAFMNISKLSNNSGKSAADWPLINTSFRLSTEGCRNFIEEEIAILEPHIVIAMYLKVNYDLLGKPLSDWIVEQPSLVKSRWIESDGHLSLLIDSWHFSARRLNDVSYYYDPICNAIRRSEAPVIGQTEINQP